LKDTFKKPWLLANYLSNTLVYWLLVCIRHTWLTFTSLTGLVFLAIWSVGGEVSPFQPFSHIPWLLMAFHLGAFVIITFQSIALFGPYIDMSNLPMRWHKLLSRDIRGKIPYLMLSDLFAGVLFSLLTGLSLIYSLCFFLIIVIYRLLTLTSSVLSLARDAGFNHILTRFFSLATMALFLTPAAWLLPYLSQPSRGVEFNWFGTANPETICIYLLVFELLILGGYALTVKIIGRRIDSQLLAKV